MSMGPEGRLAGTPDGQRAAVVPGGQQAGRPSDPEPDGRCCVNQCFLLEKACDRHPEREPPGSPPRSGSSARAGKPSSPRKNPAIDADPGPPSGPGWDF